MDITPEEFNLKSMEEKQDLIDAMINQLKGFRDSFKAFKDNKFVEIECYKVFRPLIQEPGHISLEELNFIMNNYPRGEDRNIPIQDLDTDYKKLYYFKKGYCIECYTDSLQWDIGDKRFIYYCLECKEEKNFFCKHCRYD